METRDMVLNRGDRVSLAGLKAEEMNGKQGTIVCLPDGTSQTECRYGVWVDGYDKPVKIKATNLTIDESVQNQEGASSAAVKSPDAEAKDRVFQKGDRVTLTGLQTSKFNGKQGVIVSPSDPANENRYGVRVKRIRKVIGIKAENLHPVVKTTQEHKKEYQKMINLERGTEEEYMNADQLQMMRMMMNMFLTEENQIKAFGRKIEPLPDYRLELIREGGGFPKAINHSWADKYLRTAYEQECALPHMFEVDFKSPNYKPAKEDLMKRLRTFDRSKLKWYYSSLSAPGDVYQGSIFPEHANCLRYSYSNQAYRKMTLFPGTTHVAVGFVDLGILFEAKVDFNLSEITPLRFIGVDSSAYVVAKTSLIWELIQHAASMSNTKEKDLYKRYIMQVWFSTTWSEGTEKAVKEALSSLLSSSVKKFQPEVKLILEHWRRASSIPLKEARTKVQSFKSVAGATIGMLKNKRDRISVAKYNLTGDFGVRDPVGGNIIYFDCPDGTPPPPIDEFVFSALPFDEVMKIANQNSRMTIMEAAETYALAGITKLVSWCGSNRVTVELRCSRVQDAIPDIALQIPDTISWSNLLDYMDHADFHKMASGCNEFSGSIHYGYSMNWSSVVQGTCLIDYAGWPSAIREELIDRSNTLTQLKYLELGWESYFRFPLAQNPINTVAKSLQDNYYPNWVAHFNSSAIGKGMMSIVVLNAYYGVYSPLSCTGESTVYLSWRYDFS